MNTIDNLAINSIRILSADAIQKANSGHPGLPLGSAPMAYELWAHHMNHNPANPEWANRDRFILSGGHGSMLLYSLLHLFGYGLTKEDLMNFRQVGSLTPGHPEYGHTVGVEATTGPLGAGMGMAVGMAMAEKHLASVFNKESYPVVDHFTYVLGGDGCMMEGISSEAFSLAGTLGLGKLIVLYDSNRISIEGSTDIAFRENVEERMKAFGFQTITVEDGTDIDAIGAAIEVAKADTELLLWISGLPAEVYTHFAVSVRKNRSRESHSRSGKIRELQTAFLCHSADRSRNIAQDILSVLLFSCRNLPLLYESSVFLKDTELHACSADIDSNTL